MSKGNNWEAGVLNLVLNNQDFANVGDAGGLRGSVSAGSLYLSLHTADPGEAGNQETNETGYTGYAREAIARSGSAWTVSGTDPTQASPAADVDFGECTALPGGDLTHFGVGTAASGAGVLLYSGTLTPNIVMATGVIPRLKTTSTIEEG